MHYVLHFLTATVARACILLAFSEFVFLNEMPVLQTVAGPSVQSNLWHLAQLILFYCLSGSLLLVLEPYMISWPKTFFVGAFVGWSIESVLVPVAYEAIPLSYFWTSVAWHGVWDVMLACVLMRLWMQSRLRDAFVGFAFVGLFWGQWATWPWDDMQLTLEQFIWTTAIVGGLLAFGYRFYRPMPDSPALIFWGAIATNLLFWSFWAVMTPLAAAGLAVVALANLWLLRNAPVVRLWITPDRPINSMAYLSVPILCLAACASYALALQVGPFLPSDDIVPLVMALGTLAYLGCALWTVYARFKSVDNV